MCYPSCKGSISATRGECIDTKVLPGVLFLVYEGDDNAGALALARALKEVDV